MEEARAQENQRLQSALQEMQLQFKETKLLLEKEKEATKIAAERAPVIQEIPVVDHALLEKLSSENEKLKVKWLWHGYLCFISRKYLHIDTFCGRYIVILYY